MLSALRRDRALAAVAGLTALAAAIRFSTLDVQSLSGDEGVTSALLRMSFGDMLATIPDTESTPLIFTVEAYGPGPGRPRKRISAPPARGIGLPNDRPGGKGVRE